MLPTSYRYFLSVAESGSIRASSQMLNVAASAISRQIQILEHQFGHQLFERFAAGMILTQEGHILARHLRRTMHEVEAAHAEIDALHGLVTGTIRFAAIEGVLTSWLIPAMADFRAQHPGITFDARILGSQAAYDLVMAQRLDFGVVVFSQGWQGIEILKRYETPLSAAMRPDHPLAAQDTVSARDLVGQPMTMLDRTFATRHAFDQLFAQAGLEPTVAFEVNHIEIAKRHVRATGGVTVLPQYAVSADVAEGNIVARPVSDKYAGLDTVIFTRKNSMQLKATEAFLDNLMAFVAIP